MENFKPDYFNNDPVPYDESLHSFILRHQLLFHPEIKPIGVITGGGSWRKSVFVPKKAQHIFHSFPDHELLEVIDDGTVVTGFNNKLHDSPTRYTERVKEVFFHERPEAVKSRGNIRVSFCEYCINESISNFGYGYFKTAWNYKSKCEKHGVQLRQLPPDGFSKNFKRIKSILKGNISKSFFSKQPVFLDSPHRNVIDLKDKNVNTFYPVKVARCAIVDFLKWIISGDNREVYELARKHIGVSNIINDINAISYCEKDERMALDRSTSIYESLQGLVPDLVRVFVKDESEIVKIDLGPRKQGALVELAAKKKGLSCSECKFSRCYMNEIDSYDLIDEYKIDIYFILRNSYTISRIAFQGIIFKPMGNNLWSPLKLCSDLDGDSTLTAVEVESLNLNR